LILAYRPILADDRLRLLDYKLRLLGWIDEGATGDAPEPLKRSYRRHWTLRRKIADALQRSGRRCRAW